jgi:ribosome biogenesis GTPase
MNTFNDLGYNPFFDQALPALQEQQLLLARVTQEHRGGYVLRTELLEIPSEVSGKMMHDAASRADFPAVGDWVGMTLQDHQSYGIIHRILPRRTVLERKSAGRTSDRQIIAANIDFVFIFHALDQPFISARMERSIVLVRESGAEPILLFSKKDCCRSDEVEQLLSILPALAGAIPFHIYSIHTAADLVPIAAHISAGLTFCMLGPSGSGKSSLINALAGEELLPTGEVRAYDAKGRHTTTSRELVVLKQGGVLIDTPGIRELGMWEITESVDDAYDDILELSLSCKFRNCSHRLEPHCAVRLAVEEGTLSVHRLDQYLKLKNEVSALAKPYEALRTERPSHDKKKHSSSPSPKRNH